MNVLCILRWGDFQPTIPASFFLFLFFLVRHKIDVGKAIKLCFYFLFFLGTPSSHTVSLTDMWGMGESLAVKIWGSFPLWDWAGGTIVLNKYHTIFHHLSNQLPSVRVGGERDTVWKKKKCAEMRCSNSKWLSFTLPVFFFFDRLRSETLFVLHGKSLRGIFISSVVSNFYRLSQPRWKQCSHLGVKDRQVFLCHLVLLEYCAYCFSYRA